jgi:hypothetical protein
MGERILCGVHNDLRGKLLRIVRKTLRDGYLTEELDALIDTTVEEILDALVKKEIDKNNMGDEHG